MSYGLCKATLPLTAAGQTETRRHWLPLHDKKASLRSRASNYFVELSEAKRNICINERLLDLLICWSRSRCEHMVRATACSVLAPGNLRGMR